MYFVLFLYFFFGFECLHCLVDLLFFSGDECGVPVVDIIFILLFQLLYCLLQVDFSYFFVVIPFLFQVLQFEGEMVLVVLDVGAEFVDLVVDD